MEPHQRSRCFSVGLPTPQTYRHLMAGTKCWSWPSHASNLPPPHGRHEVLELALLHLKPTATTWSERREGEHVREGGRRAVAASSLLCDAWLGGAAPEAQAPLPWLRGVALETRPPVAEFMPRLRGTALLARIPFAELGPWPRGTAHEARAPFVEIGPGWRGTALATQVPFGGTAP